MNINIYKKYYAKKHLGQHFLHDNNIINTIISTIHPQSGQNFVEIGPGLGALTIPILQYVPNLTLIELDQNLFNYLSNHPVLKNKVKIILQDAIKVNFISFLNQKFQMLRIFGNIPYNISIPLIFHLLKYIQIIDDIHLMLQKEVADRLIALPNNKKYGQLSIITQYFFQIHPIIQIFPSSFWPKPKVNSTFIKLKPYKVSPFPICHYNSLITITKLAFSQRRKMLRNSLAKLLNKKQFIQQNIDDKLRAENLSIEEYCHLANFIYNIPK